MLDFIIVSTRSRKSGVLEIYPKFIIKESKDLMIRGNDFYAIWDEARGSWSTKESVAKELIDAELTKYRDENKAHLEAGNVVKVLYLWDSESGMMDQFHR